MAKSIESRKKCLQRASDIIIDLMSEGYDPGEIAMVSTAMAAMLQHLGTADGDIDQSADWFRAAVVEVYHNIKLSPEIERIKRQSAH